MNQNESNTPPSTPGSAEAPAPQQSKDAPPAKPQTHESHREAMRDIAKLERFRERMEE